MATFSRSLVMQRYHHDVGLRENLSYRWKLYKVGIQPCFPLSDLLAAEVGPRLASLTSSAAVARCNTSMLKLLCGPAYLQILQAAFSGAEAAFCMVKYCRCAECIRIASWSFLTLL